MNDITTPTLVPSSHFDGAALTPPVLGRITIGHVEVDPDGAVVPVKDDHFSVTTLVQREDRSWEPHPIQKKLGKGQDKLVRIPIRLAFNDPELTLQRSYVCFDTFDPQGRPLCVGNGRVARRMSGADSESVSCPRPAGCEFAQQHGCRSMMKLYVQIDGQDDDLGVFLLRSSGEASYNSVAYRLSSLAGATGNLLAGMPLVLELKTRTTWKPDLEEYFHIDLPFRSGKTMIDAFAEAKTYQAKLTAAGINQTALEEAIRRGHDDALTLDVPEEYGDFGSNVIPFPSRTAKRRIKGLDATMERIRNKTFHVVPLESLVGPSATSTARPPVPVVKADAVEMEVVGNDDTSVAPLLAPRETVAGHTLAVAPPLPFGGAMRAAPRLPSMMQGPCVPPTAGLSCGPAVPVFPT